MPNQVKGANIVNDENIVNDANVEQPVEKTNVNNADILKAIDNIDLNKHSADEVYKRLSSFMEEGKIVGITSDCKISATGRNDEATAFNVKVVFPTDGSRKDFKGNSRKIMPTYNIAMFEHSDINTLWEINARECAVVEVFLEQHNEIMKFLVRIQDLMSEGNLAKNYCKVIDGFGKDKYHTIQGNKIITLARRAKVEEQA